MDTEPIPVTTVPVHITQPEDHAPPTLAEPASGPVAEMSGALHAGEKPLSELAPEVTVEAPTTNGEAPVESAPVTETAETASPPESKPTEPTESAEPVTTTEDVEMKDAALAEPGSAATEEKVPGANGAATPAKANNGKRKSIGGIPEHKGKKLNKKKSMPKLTHLDAQPGDYFYARLKSYPPWPSIICDESMLPLSLTSTRPVTTKKADGTYNEPYADGGKKVNDRTFPIMFLFTNEFAWIPNTDLQPINAEEMANVPEKGKSKSLVAAHKVAAENHDLQYFKEMLLAHSEAMAAEEEAQAEREAAKEAAKIAKKDKKAKRKSDVADEDVEMEDVDNDGKKSKKRKKGDVSDDDEKPAKPSKTTKLKLTSPKDPAAVEKKKEKKEPKPKAEKRKSKAAVSEEDSPVEEKEPEKPLDPAEERKAREIEVLFLRHRLQKGFLSRDQAPQEDEMPQMSSYVKKLENYGDLEVSIIKATKINKVLKALIKLNTIPKDEEFKFRERSMEMLKKWNKLLGNEPADADDKKDEPATNGVHKEEEKEPAATSTATETPAAETTSPAEVAEPVKEAAETTTPAAEPEPVQASIKVSKSEPEPVVPEAPKKAPEVPTEPAKVEVTVAPESAAGAAEATEVVKAME